MCSLARKRSRPMRGLLVRLAVTALCAGAATMALADGSAGTSGKTRPCLGEAETVRAGGAGKTPDAWLRDIRLGVLGHDVDGFLSGFRREHGADFNAEIIFVRPCVAVLSGTLLPNLGVTVNDRGDTSKLYGGLIWEIQSQSGVFFNVGVGAAVHNGELRTRRRGKKALGSRVLFRIPIKFGYQITKHHRLSFMLAHVSNAYLADPNQGPDTLGIRYGYRF